MYTHPEQRGISLIELIMFIVIVSGATLSIVFAAETGYVYQYNI